MYKIYMPVVASGSDWDIHNCITSAGYSWCGILNKCIRLWEESCNYPSNCLTWYDGCNMCQLVEGESGMELGACSKMMCFVNDIPYCSVQTPEYVIDPMPPINNPFLGDGH